MREVECECNITLNSGPVFSKVNLTKQKLKLKLSKNLDKLSKFRTKSSKLKFILNKLKENSSINLAEKYPKF